MQWEPTGGALLRPVEEKEAKAWLSFEVKEPIPNQEQSSQKFSKAGQGVG